jgi:hypothetical protein
MKMKLNWGTGIVIAMIVMVAGMLTLVSVAIRQDYDLVDNDYYQKSVNYQQHIEKVRNTEAFPKKIQFEQSADPLKLTFPNVASVQEYSGEIHFYSPVEESRDFKVPVKLNSGFSQIIGLNKLQKGRYQIKIDWQAGISGYYQEEEIVLEQ